MPVKNFEHLIFIFFALLINITNERDKIMFKCGKNNLKMKPKKSENRIPINSKDPNYKRRLDSEGFKDFNIYFDFTNIEQEIKQYKLTNYKNIFVSSINKAIQTIQSLLKVKPLIYAYYIENKQIREMGINYWDKEKFGTLARQKGITTETLEIDLVIFGRFQGSDKMGEGTLASAMSYYIESETGQPIFGLVNLNKDIDYTILHSQEYLDSIILHEFTHILGFDVDYFSYYFNNLLIKNDKYGIQRYYINSTRVVNTAKKYFNCDNVIGVELENYGGDGTAGSHWEARILLGDYMNGIIYTEEQVISEFTLALLEDTGYYKANYYTGGLMRYGKNKGCGFLEEKCVSDFEINPNFENEFFDWFNQESLFQPSCSSGRQSRTYNILWNYYNKIPSVYQYFNSSYIGGSSAADYCPVSTNYVDENTYGHYLGHCSDKGNGVYGYIIPYYNNDTNKTSYYTNHYFEAINGEKYSDNSFCYLSSLVESNKENYELVSQNIRAVCYESFCSSKSLTIKINNDFIVCPRQGGKIEVKNYEGYLLCPDYNLMCSGTALCNDMFDCVEKKSEIKEEGYIYDYIIKTSQNVFKSKEEAIDDIDNYELSEDGQCPQYCKLCTLNKKCLDCKNDYLFLGKLNEEIIKCLDPTKVNIGNYKFNDTFYYECIENCDVCQDSVSCDTCNENSIKLFNKCIKKIENCVDYNENGNCTKCQDNYAFIEEDRNTCVNIEQLNSFYSIDNRFSFIKCDGDGKNHINNCNECHFDETLICDECTNDYYNLFSKCVPKIENCENYDENGNCIKCIDNYAFIENDRNTCIEIEQLDNYYSTDNSISYIKCDGEGDNHIKDCNKCHFDEKLICDECKENKYNLISKCVKIIENCEVYNENGECLKCINDYAFLEDYGNICKNIKYLDGYYTIDEGINYIKCNGEGSNHIKNCLACEHDQKLICLECMDDYILNEEEEKCIIDNSEFYYHISLYFILVFILFL